MRLLHISDLHYGFQAWREPSTVAPVGSYTHTLVNSLTEALGRSAGDAIHALVVTGDITNTASDAEFDVAANEIRALAVHLRLDLASVVVTPGNHDINWSLSKEHGAAASARFDPYRRFLNKLYTTQLASRLYDPAGEGFVALHQFGDDLAVGSVTSCLFEAHDAHFGYVGKAQLDRLQALLDGTAAEWKVLAMHHHVLPTPFESLPDAAAEPGATKLDGSIVRDSGLVLQRMGELGIGIVLHGHKHEPLGRYHQFTDPRARGVYILGAGSAGVDLRALPAQRPHHAQIIEVVPGRVPIVTEFDGRKSGWTRRHPVSLWQGYDETESLLLRLRSRKLGRTTLLDIVTRVSKRAPMWADQQPLDVMRGVAEIASKTQTESAYWWLVVYGVFEFTGIDRWYDGSPRYETSIAYTRLSPRGVVLLERLAGS